MAAFNANDAQRVVAEEKGVFLCIRTLQIDADQSHHKLSGNRWKVRC